MVMLSIDNITISLPYHSTLRFIASDYYSTYHCILYESWMDTFNVKTIGFIFLLKPWSQQATVYQLFIKVVTKSLFNTLYWLYNALTFSAT